MKNLIPASFYFLSGFFFFFFFFFWPPVSWKWEHRLTFWGITDYSLNGLLVGWVCIEYLLYGRYWGLVLGIWRLAFCVCVCACIYMYVGIYIYRHVYRCIYICRYIWLHGASSQSILCILQIMKLKYMEMYGFCFSF